MKQEMSSARRFQRLFDAHGDHILLYFKRRTDSEAARDGTADTFLVAWRRINDIPLGRELPWLYGVARRVLSQQRRSRRRRHRLVEKLAGLAAVAQPGPEVIVVRNAEDTEVLEALNRLRPEERELLRLATWEGLSHGEIAEVLGCTAHAVDQRLYRTSRRLARDLTASGHKPVQRAPKMPELRDEAT
jgi:RNA polymerase sigma-70 factor (ECF subfamily)